MSQHQQRRTIQVTPIFRQFLDYLVQIKYSDSVENLIEGVFQRAFFEEWMDFLTKLKMTGQSTVVEHIKDELMD